MMADLLAFVAATVVLVGLPGPNNLYISLRSLSQGRRAGVVSAFGIETGSLVHATVAALGLVAMVTAWPVVFTVITAAGAAYLVLLGIRTLRTAVGTHGLDAVEPEPLWQIYRQGVLVNLLNPKVALFFLAFLPQFTSGTDDLGRLRTELFVLGAATMVIGLLLDLGYALAAAWIGSRLGRSPRQQRIQRYSVAGIYFGLAVIAVVGSAHS
jgi:threonine/homoserine/homoserine lactone efflux protein